MAVIEAARNLLKIKNASTSEFGNNCTPVVGLLEEWKKGKKKIKGTKKIRWNNEIRFIRCCIKNNTLISKIYSRRKLKKDIDIDMRLILNTRVILKKGLIFSALSPDGSLPEIIELKGHPWFIGVQFHPEFKSRPFTPHPLFSSFIKKPLALVEILINDK